jgi:hypothetical protein
VALVSKAAQQRLGDPCGGGAACSPPAPSSGPAHRAPSPRTETEIRAEHDAARNARPDVVAEKKKTVAARDTRVSAAWKWVDKVTSILGNVARDDEHVARRVAEARPADDAGLGTGIGALAKILEDCKSAVDSDSNADVRVAEAPALASDLASALGAVRAAKEAAVADTADIDLLDGKLYIILRDLNAAGRKAIRNGDLKARLGEYVFHYLKRSGNPDPQPPAEGQPAAPPGNGSPALTPA